MRTLLSIASGVLLSLIVVATELPQHATMLSDIDSHKIFNSSTNTKLIETNEMNNTVGGSCTTRICKPGLGCKIVVLDPINNCP